MLDLISASIRGRESEANTRAVLGQLKAAGQIVSWRQTERLSQEDLQGIDFVIAILIKGRRIEVALQVKSSMKGIKVHYEKRRDIYAVNGQSLELKNQILAVIRDYKLAFEPKKEEAPVAVAKEEVMKKPQMIVPTQDHRIHVEHDYKKFKFREDNRDLKPANLTKLEKSIQEHDRSELFPILVDEKLRVLDGQHRFTIWKKLGMPIKYKIVKGADDDFIADINTAQASWSVADIIKNQAAKGNLNFSLLREDTLKYKITPMTLLSAILGIGHYNELIRNKTLIYTKLESNQVALFMNDVQIFKGFSFGKSTRFYQAYATLRTSDKYDHTTMEKQVRRWGHSLLNPQATHKSYLEDLVAAFNYNRPKDKAINIREFE
jgi:hypothetical protein